MPSVVLYGLLGAAGLLIGVREVLVWRQQRSGRAALAAAVALSMLSAMLVLLAPGTPASEAPLPCLQVHHCLSSPHRAQ